MYITTQEQDGVIVINIFGSLDMQSHQAFKTKVRELLDEGYRKFLVDVAGIQEMDSTGIGVMVSLLNSVRRRGGDLRLAGSFAPDVHIRFKLCGLEKVFINYSDVKTGIQNFKS